MTFQVEIVGRRCTGINASRRMGPHERAADDRHWRQMGWVWALAERQRLRSLGHREPVGSFEGPVIITATPLLKNRRNMPDVCFGCAPSVKAAIDGLVDARVIPDDDPTIVLRLVFEAPEVGDVDGLRLTIKECSCSVEVSLSPSSASG